jgi:hypothetical protein
MYAISDDSSTRHLDFETTDEDSSRTLDSLRANEVLKLIQAKNWTLGNFFVIYSRSRRSRRKMATRRRKCRWFRSSFEEDQRSKLYHRCHPFGVNNNINSPCHRNEHCEIAIPRHEPEPIVMSSFSSQTTALEWIVN